MKSESGLIYFLKYFTSENSKKLIQKEAEILKDFKGKDLKFKIPKIVDSSNSMILIESLGDNLSQISYYSTEINYFTIDRPFKENLIIEKELKSIYDDENVFKIIGSQQPLQNLLKNFFNKNSDRSFLTCLGHGDFTPWNVFHTKRDKIIILDWELSSDLPLFYDHFHFKIQPLIMLSKLSPHGILGKLNLRQLSKKVLELTNREIDIFNCLVLYLISIMTYYVPIYQKQEKLHWQGRRAIEIWQEILIILLENEDYYRKNYI